MSELSHPIHQCDHVGCKSNGGREEYCEVRGRDPEADVAIVAQYLDAILLSNPGLAGDGIMYESASGYSHLQQDFNLLHSDNRHWVWPLIETGVSISREETASPKFVSYEITVAWRIHQAVGLKETPYATTYTLELWNASAQSKVREYDFQADSAKDMSPTSIRDRAMTPYDHGVLFDLLRDIEAMQTGHTNEDIELQ